MSVASADTGTAPLLTVRKLGKRFGPTVALQGVDFELREREIHALVGSSGAGKSTLLDIISGLDTCDSGEIVYRGFPIRLRSRRDALRIGITVVGQQTTLVPDMTVGENIAMPQWGRGGRFEPPEVRQRIASILQSFGWSEVLPLDLPARQLPPAHARLAEIARAFAARAKVFILDEPFASLPARDIDNLVGVMMQLRLSGCGLIVAGTQLAELSAIADRVTVLCRGRTALGGAARAGRDLAALRHAMGLAPASTEPPAAANEGGAPIPGGSLAMTVRGLAAPTHLSDVSFTLQRGEILGLHGLRGAGRRSTLMVLGGLRPRTAGTVELAGLPLGSDGARSARKAGLVLVDTDQPPLLPAGTARHQMRLMPRGPGPTWDLDALAALLRLPAGSLDVPMATRPDGERRRLALACALASAPPVLLLDDPMKGLDAEARAAVHDTLRQAATRGSAMVMTAGTADDLLAVAGRIVVLRSGRSVADLPRAMADAEALTLLAAPDPTFARNTDALTTLARENGGSAFWALLRDAHVVCLNTAVAAEAGDTGLRPGRAMPIAATRIAEALTRRDADFVIESSSQLATLLVPIRTRRGGDHGVIGLTMPAGQRLPPASAVAFHVETLVAAL